MAGLIWIKGTMTKATTLPEKTADISALSFEAAMKELEAIVRGLESGSADLDKAIADYQRGNALKEHCMAKLAEAKLKVEQIQMKSDGSVTTKAFATE
jgi:exodeoxyribonuclease VII small subunit